MPSHAQEIYSAETHYSRTTRGDRSDVVTVYSATTLAPLHEIRIPPKRGSTIPTLHNAILTDDERFMVVFNITPASSASVVDVRSKRFVRGVERALSAFDREYRLHTDRPADAVFRPGRFE